MEPITVFIVEDDLKIIEIHKMFIEKIEGFKVVGIADDIDDAIKMIHLLNPELVLLDIFFPNSSGLDLAFKIRSARKEIDFILITAAQEIEFLKDALKVGVFDYIIKPVIFKRFKESLTQYKEYKRKIKQKKYIEQSFVDSLLHSNIGRENMDNDEIPKGIDPITLNKVKEFFLSGDVSPLTAAELGKLIGMSRSTARRYLEYLVSCGFLITDHDYGSVGRPQRKYLRKR